MTCSLSECQRDAWQAGLCQAHYNRKRRHGDPRAGGPLRRSKRDDPRVWFRGKLTPDEECMVWTGRTNAKGYGVTSLNGESLAHRAAWVLENGSIPDELFVCHRCDNPPCCRIEHLFLGTARANNQDMLSKGRGHAKLSERDIDEIPALRADGHTWQEIGDRFGVHLSTAWLAHRNREV